MEVVAGGGLKSAVTTVLYVLEHPLTVLETWTLYVLAWHRLMVCPGFTVEPFSLKVYPEIFGT